MKVTSISFEKLPFPDIFRSYIRQSDRLQTFYQDLPFDDASVRQQAESFQFRGDREKSVKALLRYNEQFDAPKQTLKQIRRLKQPDALAVVTGQQLVLYGGPLFTAYKTLTTILYARRWEKLLKRPVVPVFWLADEDHDFQEAGEVGVLHDEQLKKLQLPGRDKNQPVGREILAGEFQNLEKELFRLLPETNFTADLKEQLRDCYREGISFRDDFARWLLAMFAKQGLILAGSDDSSIKELISQPMQAAVEDHEQLFRSLDEQSLLLEKQGFKRQALVQDSNLFYLDPVKGRQKLTVAEGGEWSTGNGRVWSRRELASEIRQNPASFSPNVFLRPIMQDLLLPTLAYVPGPGELSYYGQMKAAYEWLGQKMPMLLPRFSMTLKEQAIERISRKLPFEFHEYSMRIEDLEALYLKRSDAPVVDDLFNSWISEIDRITNEKAVQIEKIDPTLEASADKAGTLAKKEIGKVQQKTLRAIKKQEMIQLKRIRRIKEYLFPKGGPQERQISLIYFMNSYGLDIWDRLVTALEEETPDTHKIICL